MWIQLPNANGPLLIAGAAGPFALVERREDVGVGVKREAREPPRGTRLIEDGRHFPGIAAPETDRIITGLRGQEAAIGRKGEGQHRTGMPFEHVRYLSQLAIPKPDRRLVRPGRE